MITESPPGRRAAGALTAMALTVGALLLPISPALAADGSAPGPREYRVLQGLHTDAVSTFLDEGEFVLASKADVPEGNGTRFAADDVWFHLDNGAAMTLPAGFEFIAPGGSQVWIAPQGQQAGLLWPGFSTESVPLGAIDGNTTTFTLLDVDGPGDLELFTNGAFGGANRIWSSDEDGYDTLQVGRVHMHANWAFTAAGRYDLTVEGAVAIGGVQHTDTATYTFFVGDLPEDVDTATTLEASSTELVLGESTTLTAMVAPSDVEGYVEFRDGGNVLGHEDLVDGAASFTADDLGIGIRSLTAVFVPAVENLANTSASPAVSVEVIDGTGLEFGIRGIEDSYSVGDTLSATIVGYTLAENEVFRWLASHAGSGDRTWTINSASATFELPLDVSYDGYLLRGVVYDTVAAAIIAETAPVEVHVSSLISAPALSWIDGPEVYLGSPATASVTSPDGLAAGDTVVGAFRQTGPWLSAEYAPIIDGATLTHSLPFNMTGHVHLQVVRDGKVISQSEGYPTAHRPREVLLEGAQGIYRVGQTMQVNATVYPLADTVDYEWRYRDGAGVATTSTATPDANGAFRFERELTLADDGGDLRLSATFINAFGFASTAGSGTIQIHVSDANPDEQLVALDALAGHYHQGGNVSLRLSADPATADTDVITWQWRWPGGDWATIDGFDSATEQLTAEQALDGVEVRATLTITGIQQSFTTDAVTIHVDDHGAAAHQRVTIAGLAEQYQVGDAVALTATVAPTSVLDRWEWYVQRTGEETPMLVDGENEATLSFAAAENLDGAAVFARLTFPDGTAYVESAPVLLDIEEGDEPVDEEPVGSVKPEDAPEDRSESDLTGTPEGGLVLQSTTVAQGQVLTIGLGAEYADRWVAAWLFSTPRLLNADWTLANSAGDIAGRVPDDAEPGAHQVVAFAADGSLIGWANITVTASDGTTPTGSLPQTGTDWSPAWLLLPPLLIAAGSALAAAHRRGRPRNS